MACIICNSAHLMPIIDFPNGAPLARYGLADTRKKAKRAPKLPIHIVRCENCLHFFNTAFDIKNLDYTDDNVAESRNFSLSYGAFLQQQYKMINEQFSSEFDFVLEIGCGNGEFLKNFSNSPRLVGYEPGPEGALCRESISSIELVNDYFDPKSAKDAGLHPNLIIMRQVLEHLQAPMEFLKTFHSMLSRNNGLLYLEVPSCNASLQNQRFSDFYYDHASYFTLTSLAEALRLSNFSIQKIGTGYNHELLFVLAQPNVVDATGNVFEEKMLDWQKRLAEWKIQSKNVVFWGTAGTGTNFLNLMGVSYKDFSTVVDSDTRKIGKYLPGTGQLVVAPLNLKTINPDIVVISSQLHSREITENVKTILGRDVEIYIL